MKKIGMKISGRPAAAAAALIIFAACTIAVPKGKPKPLDSRGGEPERTPRYEHAGLIVARASLHNHTVYSDGKRSPEDLLELARQQGIAILAYNDHREGKMCIGKGVCIDPGGVERAGYAEYYAALDEIKKQAAGQGMIALKGVEVIPWFYNMGKSPYLVLRGLFQHFTVYGVNDPEVLENMPARHNIENTKPEPVHDEKRWQEWVDYINAHGGMVSAVHVESEQDEWWGPVHVLTPAPVRNLHRLKGLTAFSVLPEAWRQRTGAPGGYWDSALLEYMAGLRERPMWALGDADYHGPSGSLAIATTLFYLNEFTENEVMKAMREGRMVALQGLSFQDTYVAEWSVSESAAARPVMLGETVKLKGTPTVRFALNKPVSGCKVRLVRNGVVIKEEPGTELSYVDEEIGRDKRPVYYRVEVVGPVKKRDKDEPYITEEASELFVNPIFVRFER